MTEENKPPTDDHRARALRWQAYLREHPEVEHMIDSIAMTPANRQLFGALLMLAALGVAIVGWAECQT